MRNNIVETVVAGVVLLVAAAFLFFVVNQTTPPSFQGYPLTARFASAPDLKPGSQVRVAGVEVGRVTAVQLDMERFEVEIALMVRQDLALASDTRAVISSDGLMGSGILVLQPGSAGDRLAAGDRIRFTESPVNLVDQFGRFIYGSGGAGGGDDF